MPVVDLQGVSTELEVMPEDVYPATFTSWEYNPKSKSSGEPFVAMEFEISEGEYEGRKQFRNYSLQRKALWAFKRTLVRLGAEPDELEGPIELEDIMPELIGAPCHLKIGQHVYEDELRNDVKNVLPADYAFSSDV